MTMPEREDRHGFTVQFIDGKKAALGGVGAEVYLYVDGKLQQKIQKRTTKSVRLKFPGGHEIEIEARVEGHESQRIQVGPDATQHDFQFPGAGPPIVMIVCTKDCETIAVRTTFDHYSEPIGRPNDPNIYRIGLYRLKRNKAIRNVLLVTSGMGNQMAGAVTTQALNSFPGIEHILLVGIAAGCPNPAKPAEHVRLGDIVVPDHRGIVQYDNVKETVDNVQYRGHPQLPSARMIQAARELDAEGELGKRPWEAWIEKGALEYKKAVRKIDALHDGTKAVEHPSDPDRRPGVPRVHRGAIASADTLQKNPVRRDLLRDKWDVRAIEMEGSGLQNAAWMQGKDVMIVRGICDYGDAYKNDDWQPYASLAAAAYARALIEILPNEWFP
jgi:nucleoside phosphorylase